MPKATMNPGGLSVPRGSYSLVERFHHRRLLPSDINETGREVLGSDFSTSTMVQVVALARLELLL